MDSVPEVFGRPVRTAQEQADAFVKANRHNLVIEGGVIGSGGQGARYRTYDGVWHVLCREACKLLPEGFPRWKL